MPRGGALRELLPTHPVDESASGRRFGATMMDEKYLDPKRWEKRVRIFATLVGVAAQVALVLIGGRLPRIR